MRILDTYILGRYVRTLALSIVSFLSIFIVIDLFEKIDNFIDHGVPFLTVLLYYLYRLPEIVLLTLPVCMLLACLFALGSHARANEFIATSSAGISIRRSLLPVLAAGLAVSFLALLGGETVAPESAVRVKTIERMKIKPERARSSKIHTNVNFIGEGERIFSIGRLDTGRGTMRDVVISRLSDFTVVERIDAKEAVWENGIWTFHNGYRRVFDSDRLLEEEEFDSRAFPELTESPVELSEIRKGPKEMSYGELRRFVEKAKLSGGDVLKQEVDLHMKLSYPFNNLIIVLLGAPLGALLRRGGNAIGFSLALVICFVYYLAIRVGQSLGYNDVVPPVVSAWLGNAIFLLLGSVIFFRFTRK